MQLCQESIAGMEAPEHQRLAIETSARLQVPKLLLYVAVGDWAEWVAADTLWTGRDRIPFQTCRAQQQARERDPAAYLKDHRAPTQYPHTHHAAIG